MLRFLFTLNHHINRASIKHVPGRATFQLSSPHLSYPALAPTARSYEVTNKALKERSFDVGSSNQDFCSVSKKKKKKVANLS